MAAELLCIACRETFGTPRAFMAHRCGTVGCELREEIQRVYDLEVKALQQSARVRDQVERRIDYLISKGVSGAWIVDELQNNGYPRPLAEAKLNDAVQRAAADKKGGQA